MEHFACLVASASDGASQGGDGECVTAENDAEDEEQDEEKDDGDDEEDGDASDNEDGENAEDEEDSVATTRACHAAYPDVLQQENPNSSSSKCRYEPDGVLSEHGGATNTSLPNLWWHPYSSAWLGSSGTDLKQNSDARGQSTVGGLLQSSGSGYSTALHVRTSDIDKIGSGV